MRRLRAIAIIAVAALVLAYLAGFATSQREWFPYKHIKAVAKIVRSSLQDSPPPTKAIKPQAITTTFLRLRVDRLNVPFFEAGGALASFGRELLLLTRRGDIYRVDADGAVAAQFRPPDNGRVAYEAAAKSQRYSHLQHRPERLRYNDILSFRDGATRAIAVSYTEWLDDRTCYRTVVAMLPIDGDVASILDVRAEATDWKILFQTQPCLPLKTTARALEGHIAGGRMVYRPGGRIIVGFGDYHFDGVYAQRSLAQSLDNDYGKLFEIDVRSGTSRRISIGHRNPQGIALDGKNRVWVTDHGPRGGDELNLVRDGGNYGWPKTALGTGYDGLPWPGNTDQGRHDGYDAPVYAWLPSVGLSTLIRVDGFDESWNGDLLAGSLRGTSLFRLRVSDERVIFVEQIPIGRRVRDLHQHSDGGIYVWTDASVLLRLSRIESGMFLEILEKRIAEADYDIDLREKVSTALRECSECHSFEDDDQVGAPSLGGVFGRKIASTGYHNYSAALRDIGGVWTSQRLADFLMGPQAFAPGTQMPDPQLDDPAVAQALAALLESLETKLE